MARMSEPQIVEAFMRRSTSPWPGSGTGTAFRTTVLLPGRNAPCIVVAIVNVSSLPSVRDCLAKPPSRVSDVAVARELLATRQSWRRNLTTRIPQCLPGLPFLPQEDLPLDQPAVPVN